MNNPRKILMASGLMALSAYGWATTIPDAPTDQQGSGSGAEIRQPAVPPVAPAPTNTAPLSPGDDGTGLPGTEKKAPSQIPELRDAPSDPMAPADRTLADQVNQAFKADKRLSVGAKNVKVNASEGRITLRGQVATEAEKASLAASAAAIVGTENVTNSLKVKAGKKKVRQEGTTRQDETIRQDEKPTPTNWHRK